MGKANIAVYNINNLSKDNFRQHELLVERFGPYLERHPRSLHHPHRHSFFHLVLFTKGSGTHSIDFTTYPVNAYQIYFMIPGQVHSWQFEGETDGYIVNSPTVFSAHSWWIPITSKPFIFLVVSVTTAYASCQKKFIPGWFNCLKK
jgi:hypothetical protein